MIDCTLLASLYDFLGLFSPAGPVGMLLYLILSFEDSKMSAGDARVDSHEELPSKMSQQHNLPGIRSAVSDLDSVPFVPQ